MTQLISIVLIAACATIASGLVFGIIGVLSASLQHAARKRLDGKCSTRPDWTFIGPSSYWSYVFSLAISAYALCWGLLIGMSSPNGAAKILLGTILVCLIPVLFCFALNAYFRDVRWRETTLAWRNQFGAAKSVRFSEIVSVRRKALEHGEEYVFRVRPWGRVRVDVHAVNAGTLVDTLRSADDRGELPNIQERVW